MDCGETWWDVYELIAWEPVFTGGGSTVNDAALTLARGVTNEALQ
jgi:hypothetical protein